MKVIWDYDVISGLFVTLKCGQGITVFTEEYGPIKVTVVRDRKSRGAGLVINCDDALKISRHEVKDYKDAREKLRENSKRDA